MPAFSRAPKYKAVRATHAGESFDSRSEAAYAAYLGVLEAGGECQVIQLHPRFKLGCPENCYAADFMIRINRWVVVDDVKGFVTPKFKKDCRLWAKYGKVPLRVVKLKLTYPKKGSPPEQLPTIKSVDFEVIHGGLDRTTYGPLCPEWLRR